MTPAAQRLGFPGNPRPRREGPDGVRLSIRVPVALRRRVKLHCVRVGVGIETFTQAAVRERLLRRID